MCRPETLVVARLVLGTGWVAEVVLQVLPGAALTGAALTGAALPEAALTGALVEPVADSAYPGPSEAVYLLVVSQAVVSQPEVAVSQTEEEVFPLGPDEEARVVRRFWGNNFLNNLYLLSV